MKKIKKAESFTSIIVWILILSFIIAGIANTLNYSIHLTHQYEEKNQILMLTRNIKNIVKKIDTSEIEENEIFYIYRDTTTEEYEFKIFRPEECITLLPIWWDEEICHNYRYINYLWETIPDIAEYNWDIYSQEIFIRMRDVSLWITNESIKVYITKINHK